MRAYEHINPAVLTTHFFTVLLIVMFTFHPVIELIALTGGILFCVVINRKYSLKTNLKYYILIFIFVTITNPLFSSNGETVLLSIGFFNVTLESLLYGAGLATTIITVMLWCQLYSFIMASEKTAYLFRGAAPKLSLVLSMSLRYIPLIKRQWETVFRTQKSMGMYSSESRIAKLRSLLRCFSILIGWSLENATETVRSMKARGFGCKKRTSYSDFHFRSSDIVLLTVYILLFAVTVFSSFSGLYDFAYYPKISGFNTTSSAIFSYAFFGILVLMPFFIELEETVRWNYCKLKI